MTNGGWIKTHRKLLDNPTVCKDAEHLAVWMYILLKATHDGMDGYFKGQKIRLQPGQLITGRKVISEKFRISESKVQRILNRFESEQQIEQQTSNQNRLISIVNWQDYQSGEQRIERPLNNERTTSEQPVNTNKNDKKEKNNNYIEIAEKIWQLYPNKKGKKIAINKIVLHLKKGITEEQLILATKRYSKEVENVDPIFIKHGSTFYTNHVEDYFVEQQEQTEKPKVEPEKLSKEDLMKKWGR